MKMKNRIVSTALVFVLSVSIATAADIEKMTDAAKASQTEEHFDSLSFQAGIQRETKLSELAETHLKSNGGETTYGFAAKSNEAKIFLIGTIYAESVAYFHSGDYDQAAKRLEAIEKQFITLDVSEALFNYIAKVRNRIQRHEYSQEAMADFLSCLQPFLEDYCNTKGQDELTLFRAGTWLVDMALSAAAGDTGRFRNSGKLDYFTRELQRMSAPQGVMQALAKIKKIMDKEKIGKRDTKKLLEQLKAIQSYLA